MSIHVNGGAWPELPEFLVPTPESPVPMAGQKPVEAAEALKGLRLALKLAEGERIERVYVANRPFPEWGQSGPEGGLVIASVISEPNGFVKDREIVVNDSNRHEPLGERAITWFGAVATDYREREQEGFMRGEIKPAVVESSIAA